MIENLADQEYIRQRIDPRPGDPLYLHLSDLLLAVTEAIPTDIDRVLDYGCGGSPYRHLFNGCTYHRADLVGGDSLDFEYEEGSRLPVNSSDYNCVLSSQVLEHVDSPTHYLEECYRVLKPGGKLILTTHGLFEDHGCPADYWRWTAAGLQKLVETVGFDVESVRKLTTGPRAAVFFAERTGFGTEYWRSRRYFRAVLCGLRILQGVSALRRHRACDTCFPQHRVVDASAAGHGTYIAIAMTARR